MNISYYYDNSGYYLDQEYYYKHYKNFLIEQPKNHYVINYYYNKPEEKMKEIFYVYDVLVIDRNSCDIIKSQRVVAKNQENAMLDLEITQEIKKKIKEDEVVVIFNKIGEFYKKQKDEKD